MNLEEYQKIDEMDTKLWNIGFYREFACDFEYDGWQEFDDNVLHGLDEPNIRILHSLDVVREFPNLLPENLLFFAFGGSAEDFMEKMLRNSSACGFSGTFITYDIETIVSNYRVGTICQVNSPGRYILKHII